MRSFVGPYLAFITFYTAVCIVRDTELGKYTPSYGAVHPMIQLCPNIICCMSLQDPELLSGVHCSKCQCVISPTAHNSSSSPLYLRLQTLESPQDQGNIKANEINECFKLVLVINQVYYCLSLSGTLLTSSSYFWTSVVQYIEYTVDFIEHL